jgi:tetratricopeptide (TPR) repeat protein
VAEKIPLLLLSTGSCVLTILVPEKLTVAKLPFGLRMENAAASYVTYLWQMICPSGLACYYPNLVNYLAFWQVAGALVLLLVMSATVWAFRNTHPCFVVGWLWYLGMMIPVIGIVQISNYSHADRYTYLPQIGLYLIVAWAATGLLARRRHGRWLLGALASAVLVVLMLCARTQVSYWKDSQTLWEHTLTVSGDTDVAHNNLGMDLLEKGKPDEAIEQYQEALKANPAYYPAHDNLGVALARKGKPDEAMAQFQQALKINHHDDMAYNNLGLALAQTGHWDEAIARYQQALAFNPDFEKAHVNLGIALAQQRRWDEAIAHYQQALEINPNDASAHDHLGYALVQTGHRDEAIGHLQQALELNSDLDTAHFNLGNALFREGKVDEAIAQYQLAVKINPDFAMAHNDLGIALDKKGQLDAAATEFRQALKTNPDYALGHLNLGNVLLHQGKTDEAIAQYQLALKADPNLEPAHNSLGYVLLQKGQWNEAIGHYERALELNPGIAGRCNRLAWALATHPEASVRNGEKAMILATQLNRLSGGKDVSILQTLAAAYAETGHFPEAASTAQQALQIATARKDTALVNDLQQQIACYRADRPFRDAGLTNTPAFPRQ